MDVCCKRFAALIPLWVNIAYPDFHVSLKNMETNIHYTSVVTVTERCYVSSKHFVCRYIALMDWGSEGISVLQVGRHPLVQ